jgi:hypothetical protein
MADFGKKFFVAVRLLGSPHEGEREGAAHAIYRLLGETGIKELASVLEEQLNSKPTDTRPPPWEDEDAPPTGLQKEWLAILAKLFNASALLSEWEEEFIRSVHAQLTSFRRTEPSPKQTAILCRIYLKIFKKDLVV